MPKKVVVTEAKLKAVADSIIATVLRKNADYADAWQVKGRIGALIRAMDKGFRFINLTQNMTVYIVDETLADTLRDLVGYSLLMLLHMEEVKDEESATDSFGAEKGISTGEAMLRLMSS